MEYKFSYFAEKILPPITQLISKIGSGILIVMLFITVADVVGRKFFNLPVKGSYELGEMLLVLVVFLNLPYTEMQDGNVSIEIVFSRFGKTAQTVVHSLMYVLFLLISVLMTWQLFALALDEWTDGFTTTVLHIPTAPVILLASIGCFFLSVVVLTRLIVLIWGRAK